MYVSLAYMHYQWKSCLVVWHGQFQDKNDNRSIIFEIIEDQSF
jgi:hypothetical protein